MSRWRKSFREERLGEIKGIGEALQQKITELVTTDGLKYYDELKASIPPGMREMLEIPGVGPKKIKAMYDKLGIDTIEKLEAGVQGGQGRGAWRASAKRRRRKFARASSGGALTPRAICS